MYDTFKELGIAPEILKAVEDMGFEEPSPIQKAAIPIALTGKDLIGQAQTGTGKTAAFGIPILERIDTSKPGPQAVVLSPTRELAIQSAEEINHLAQYLPIHALLNMDSNYGPLDFTAAAKLTKNAHHGVAESLIETCQELKDSIRISTHSRPAWDVERLQLMGFSSVTWEEDIRPLVHLSKEWDYDPLPLFCIRAVK